MTPRVLLSIGDQCLVSGTNFLTLVIVGRSCGLQELGVYSLAFTVVVILMALQESLLIAPYTVMMSRLARPDRAGWTALVRPRRQRGLRHHDARKGRQSWTTRAVQDHGT